MTNKENVKRIWIRLPTGELGDKFILGSKVFRNQSGYFAHILHTYYSLIEKQDGNKEI
ncbi:hypothetical protein EOM39_04480 [Candidatus Gracilibacteria bacterium]|nr:hypothetical protein [Candidatus Gracilibacteria bacterium]